MKKELKKEVKKVEKIVKKEKKEVSADVTLKATDKALEKLSKKENVLKKISLQKTVNTIASTIAKMAAVIGEQEERLVKLENTPAAIKSKVAYVHKDEETKKPVKKDGNRASQIGKRLDELEALKEKLGPNNFAKQGFSHEAGKLMTELEKLG